MDCSSPYVMESVINRIGAFDLAVGNDPDYDRYGIVVSSGLVSANSFLTMAARYLFTTRDGKIKALVKLLYVLR